MKAIHKWRLGVRVCFALAGIHRDDLTGWREAGFYASNSYHSRSQCPPVGITDGLTGLIARRPRANASRLQRSNALSSYLE